MSSERVRRRHSLRRTRCLYVFFRGLDFLLRHRLSQRAQAGRQPSGTGDGLLGPLHRVILLQCGQRAGSVRTCRFGHHVEDAELGNVAEVGRARRGPPFAHVQVQRGGECIGALLVALDTRHTGHARGDQQGQQLHHGRLLLLQQPRQHCLGGSWQALDPGLPFAVELLPRWALRHVFGFATQAIVRVGGADVQGVVAAPEAAEAVLDELDRQLRGDRGERHVGPKHEFGLDGRHAMRSEAPHQLLRMHRAGVRRGQRDQGTVGAVVRAALHGLPSRIDDAVAILGPDQTALDFSGAGVAHEHHTSGLGHQLGGPHTQSIFQDGDLRLQGFRLGFELEELLVLAGLVVLLIRQRFHPLVPRGDLRFEFGDGGGFLRFGCAARLAQLAVLREFLEVVPGTHFGPLPTLPPRSAWRSSGVCRWPTAPPAVRRAGRRFRRCR